MMNKLSREDLMSLEEYADDRADFRAEVLAHKKNRAVELGNHLRLLFEDSKNHSISGSRNAAHRANLRASGH